MFSRIPILRIHDFFSQFFFLLNQDRIILLRSEMLLKYFHKKRHFPAPFKENKTFVLKKIREFVDLEFVKICHKQVTIPQK